MAKTTCNKSRWVRRKEARPQELLASALALFIEQGYASTRLEDIARRAGVSKPTMYLYFKSKEELFKAVVRGRVVPVIAEIETLLAGFEGDSAELMRRVIMLRWVHAGAKKDAGLIRVITAEANNFPELATVYRAEVIGRDMRLIAKVLDRGIARHEFRQVDLALATEVLTSAMLMLTMWNSAVQPLGHLVDDPVMFLEALVDLMLGGLLPR
ncbi:TetR/AcrR family transcriptional regulator [Massilia jejuensis]|uniref:TetR/AcrR family transcriptional regulator n=1 Tax=Massilia jejuensis TaxID=648894 RepID=A0ABW0PNM2_9BURK